MSLSIGTLGTSEREPPPFALMELPWKLPHLPTGSGDRPEITESAAIVNGVALPQRVVEELRRLGIAISWYTQGELEAAVEACAVDGQLVDDDDGVDFMDKLQLRDHEHEGEDGEKDTHRLHMLQPKGGTIHPELEFSEMLLSERKRKRKKLAEGDKSTENLSA